MHAPSTASNGRRGQMDEASVGVLTSVLQHASVTMYIYTFLMGGVTCLLLSSYTMLWLAYKAISYTNIGQTVMGIIVDVTSTRPIDSSHDQHSLFPFIVVLSCVILYVIYWWFDRNGPEHGSHPKPFMRRLFVWRYIRDYFPIKLILSSEADQMSVENDQNSHVHMPPSDQSPSMLLPSRNDLFTPSRNYLVGFHPHGIFGISALINFGTEANEFSSRFPGLTAWLTTLEIQFKPPFYRDLIMSLNCVAATYNGISYLLDPDQYGKTGNFVVVVIGGSHEALDAQPNKYVLHMKRKFGFFKLALMMGADLVPCISFGEQNMYHQVRNTPSSRLRKWQDRFSDFATFSCPLFYARALLPYRKPVTTIVGEPIRVEQVKMPSRSQVSELKERYTNDLLSLFARYKPIYDPYSADIEFL